MKEYGRNGRLKPEKKKKRKFEAFVNTATQGIYSDFTPMKVAKKVTSELVGKKKQIIFHLREKGKSGKTYGYIGNIRDGKVVVKIHKMSGGEMGCVFNRIMPNNFKVDKSDFSNPPEIEITKFCVTRATIIFFCTENYRFLEKDGNIYYTYAIYREGDKVFVKKLMYDVKGELIATLLGEGNIGIGKIAADNIHERKRTLEKIKSAIEAKEKDTKKTIAQNIISAINTYLQSVQSGNTREQTLTGLTEKQKETARFLALRTNLGFTQQPRTYTSSVPISTAPTTFAQQPQQKNTIIQPYICLINNPIEEFKVSTLNEIFFGFDINLLKTQPLPAKLYYKYSYRNGKFYQLIENKNGNLDESQPIDISQIPLYDLLCLYEFFKLENIKIHITGKTNKTAPNSKETITRLNNSNFKINKNSNIGKIKRKVEIMQGKRKTYYFFGKSNGKYKYVCYREGEGNKEKVYYFDRNNIKEIKDLMDLQDRSALEDLKSFIILRRIKNPEDKEFGKGVYEKASERIGQLKFQEIHAKINLNQFQFQTQAQSPTSQQPQGNFLRSTLSSPLPSSSKKIDLQPPPIRVF
jgi:hypothetical protein